MTAKEMALVLAQRDLPLLGATVRQILAVTDDEDSRSIAEISQVVSQDPALVALVLRMANSSFFNQSGSRICTLSRAIIVLGLEQMRTLCYSAVLLETTVKAHFRDQVHLLLKTSLETAGQARFLAQKLGGDADAYFLAGLLAQVGRIAFWCAGGEEADQLRAALENGEAPLVAERRILGFTLDQVNTEIVAHWGLSHLQNLPALRNVPILKEASEIVGHLQKKDLSALEIKLAGLRPHFRQPSQELLKALRQVQEQTLALVPPEWFRVRKLGKNGVTWTELDSSVQLQSLADMHALPKTGAYLPALVQTALEGLHRGGRWDLSLFAVRLETGWVGKLKSGWLEGGPELWKLGGAHPEDLLLNDWKPVSIEAAPGCSVLQAGDRAAAGLLHLGGRAVGLLYADRTRSGRNVQFEQLQSFELFYRQLNLVLQGFA